MPQCSLFLSYILIFFYFDTAREIVP